MHPLGRLIELSEFATQKTMLFDGEAVERFTLQRGIKARVEVGPRASKEGKKGESETGASASVLGEWVININDPARHKARLGNIKSRNIK